MSSLLCAWRSEKERTMILRIFMLLIALSASATIPQTKPLTVSDFFGDFEGASLVNPKQLGPNHFALETQSAEKYGGQGRLGVWVCAGIRLNKATVSDRRCSSNCCSRR